MGSPQPTTLLKLRYLEPDVAAVIRARSVVVEEFPRWLKPAESLDRMTYGETGIAALNLLADLIFAIQMESGIAVAKAAKVQRDPLNADEATVFLPTASPVSLGIAINWSVAFLNHLIAEPAAMNVQAAVDKARQKLKPHAEPGINNFFICQAAHALGYPLFRPVQDLWVLGTGCRSRWLQSLVSDATTFLGVSVAQSKLKTASLLRAAGMPGSVHQLVKSREHALKVAHAFGYPVVVKPADADRGAGVAAGLMDAAAVALAYEVAAKVSAHVLVERWAPGNTHRLTVQEGQVVRVVRRTAGGVVGDGVHTVAQLVTLFQQTPAQQRLARLSNQNPLSIDDEAASLLIEHGMSPQSRPDEGVYVKLRRRDNINAGGTNEELDMGNTSIVHPDNTKLAIEAARALRLDFAGIDLITTDIAKSWLDVGALICEVNARPQMGGRNDPDLYQRLLRRMFPNGAAIPAELVVVPDDALEQARVKDHLLRARSAVSVSAPSGLWIDGVRATSSFKHSFDAAQSLLQRQEVMSAACCMTLSDIRQYGLPTHNWNTLTVMLGSHIPSQDAATLKDVQAWLNAAEQTT